MAVGYPENIFDLFQVAVANFDRAPGLPTDGVLAPESAPTAPLHQAHSRAPLDYGEVSGMDWLLIGGDVAIILSFALGGVSFHQVAGNPLWAGLRIALPFLLGYLTLAALTGALRWRRPAWQFAGRSLAAWILGMPVGFWVRSLILAIPPNPIFVKIALIYTATLLCLWRTAFWLWRRFRPGCCSYSPVKSKADNQANSCPKGADNKAI